MYRGYIKNWNENSVLAEWVADDAEEIFWQINSFVYSKYRFSTDTFAELADWLWKEQKIVSEIVQQD